MFWWKLIICVSTRGHQVAMAHLSQKLSKPWALDWIQIEWLHSPMPSSSPGSSWMLPLPFLPWPAGLGCVFSDTSCFHCRRKIFQNWQHHYGFEKSRFLNCPRFPNMGSITQPFPRRNGNNNTLFSISAVGLNTWKPVRHSDITVIKIIQGPKIDRSHLHQISKKNLQSIWMKTSPETHWYWYKILVPVFLSDRN